RGRRYRAAHEDGCIRVGVLYEREIDRRLRWQAEPHVARVTYHANDGHPDLLPFLVRDVLLLVESGCRDERSHRILSGPVQPGHRLVDDDGARTATVDLAEVPAVPERNPQRREVATRYHALGDRKSTRL